MGISDLRVNLVEEERDSVAVDEKKSSYWKTEYKDYFSLNWFFSGIKILLEIWIGHKTIAAYSLLPNMMENVLIFLSLKDDLSVPKFCF